MTRLSKLKVDHAWTLAATPGAKMLTDMFVIAPRAMWHLRSRRMRALLALCERHPRSECQVHGYGESVSYRGRHVLRDVLREHREADYLPATQGERVLTDGVWLIPFTAGQHTARVNVEFVRPFTERGYRPFVVGRNEPVQWRDGKRIIGYTMPVFTREGD